MILNKDQIVLKEIDINNIEQLLTVGFLTLPIDIDGISFIFKTISPSELFLIKNNSLLQGKLNNIKFIINYIIYSIFLVEGFNILLYREQCFANTFNIIKTWNGRSIILLYDKLIKLGNKVSNLQKKVPEFNKSDKSKYYWSFYKNSNNCLNDSKNTGIEGTDKLGLNYIQKSWIVLNSFDDKIRSRKFKNEELGVIWSYAKFIAACFNPKAVRNVEAQEKVQKQIQKQEEQTKSGKTGFINNNPNFARPQNTTENLVDELKALSKGNKDKHDNLINALYKRKQYIKKHKKQELEEKRKKLNLDLEQGIDGETSIIDYNQIQKRFLKGKK